eukprot:757953_1
MMTFIFRYAYLLAVCLWGLQLFGMVSTAQLPDYNQGVNPSNVPSDLKEEDPPSLEYAENECAWGACPNSNNIPMPKLKRCKGCKSTYYCGKSCQKRHWNSRHRLNCSAENECAWGACPNSNNIPMPKLKRCKGCKATYYCGKPCQKRHWNSLHRFNCSEIQTNENLNEEKKEIPVGNEELYVEKKRNSSENEMEMENDGDQKSVEEKLPVGRWVYVAEIRSKKNVQLSLKEILKTHEILHKL